MIKPRCLNGKDYAYSATGFILPCCYADNMFIEDFSELMTDNLKLENNSHVKDIVYSEEWANFYRKLKSNTEDLPRSCKFHCGSNWTIKSAVKS